MKTNNQSNIRRVVLVVLSFALGFLAGSPQVVNVVPVPVTRPLTVFIRQKPIVIRRKSPVVVVPVVVGAASCPELDDGTPCLPVYDFRERCSIAVKGTR